ncbi:beta-lactamase superfamily II metal-dependent hydrolase [Mucilaginibacter sp. UYNi724]
MKRILILYVSFFLAVSAYAQQPGWEATRSAILHRYPNSASPIVARLPAGTKLQILLAKSKNNYYKVQAAGSGKKGWIYKTFISRATDTAVHVPLVFSPLTGTDSVSVRVIDVDNGLCTIIRMPGNKYVIYDAGGLNTADGSQTWVQMQKFLPEGATVELMVLSHMDGDHIVAASQAIRGYRIKKVIWGGYDRKIDGTNAIETKAFQKLKSALQDRADITESINLNDRDSVIYPGGDIVISGAHFKLLCGFGKPMPEWHLTSDAAERLNGVSIVMKVEYGGNSVLFTGDALGRRKNDAESVCIATEKFLVEHAGETLRSTIMFSPHHGAENGSSKTFLDKVRPEYIIIPAGHVSSFRHPRKTTCERYLNYVTADHIFRTDRGDDQGPLEWGYLSIPGCRDIAGDDDIQVDLRSDHKLHVYYLNPINACTTFK